MANIGAEVKFKRERNELGTHTEEMGEQTRQRLLSVSYLLIV